ncbi:M protein repeat protein [Cladophialophora carrionii]|uniref:M protein repeat protein n=1 Tax=Cladophialophora carrionii TaxID=86049 RepID=A0A1C1CAL6_9EURO|nr:M protein repeat protein [Cladophialophora carrionii]
MATEEAVAAGLIDWFNSLAVAEAVYTVDDFTNGDLIWKALQQIDRFSFPGRLPENPDTDQWINKWTNLKHIYDALSIFLVEECSQRLPLPGGRPDLKAIAQSSSLSDTAALLKLLVVAAINCADRIEYLKQMQELAESTQEVLMQTVQEAGEGVGVTDDPEAESSQVDDLDVELPTSPRRSTEMETVLESEERLGKVIADNQRIAHEKRELQRLLDEAHSRYEKLQERFDLGQDELRESNDRLAAVLAGKSDISTRPLDSKHDTLIATLENRVLEAESEIEELRKNNEVLKIKAEKAQKLQDDYDEMKIERDRLARKANTAEKYRQKLEASQDLDKENNNLRAKVTELQNQLKQSDFARARSSDLQREIDEYRRLLPSIEQERYELNEMKKRLEFDYHTLEARYHDSAEQLSRQNQAVEELQSRLSDYEDGVTPAPREEKLPEPVDKDFEKEEAELAESESRLAAVLLNGDAVPVTTKDSDLGSLHDMESPIAGLNDADTISEDELKAIMSAMRAQAYAGTATEREASLRAQKKMIIAIERQRTKNQLLLEHVQKQDQTIKDMQNKIQDAEKAPQQRLEIIPPPPPPKSVPGAPVQPPDEESAIERLTNQNTILHRELKLMASAWYDQNLRLASMSSAASARSRGNFVEARGFLGRQRRRVDAAIAGRAS